MLLLDFSQQGLGSIAVSVCFDAFIHTLQEQDTCGNKPVRRLAVMANEAPPLSNVKVICQYILQPVSDFTAYETINENYGTYYRWLVGRLDHGNQFNCCRI